MTARHAASAISPGEERSAAWWQGFNEGLADRASGAGRCICGDSQAALDRAAGYAAARYSGQWQKEARLRQQAAREAE
jgi:hypothetical protein